MKKVYLIAIDFQQDFCNIDGALSVHGANEDAERLASFINKNQKKISEIRASLDCHQTIHIAHPIFWVNDEGKHPKPFKILNEETIKSEGWKPFHPELIPWTQEYIASLKNNGRYQLTIWPEHCIFGTKGWMVVPKLMDALVEWEHKTVNRIHWIQKGNNFLTEQYSAVLADVPDPNDPSTKLNIDLIKDLADADEILWSGESLSHCLGNTMIDVANNIGEENIRKFVLLTDTTNNIDGYEELGKECVNSLVARGMKLSTTNDWK